MSCLLGQMVPSPDALAEVEIEPVLAPALKWKLSQYRPLDDLCIFVLGIDRGEQEMEFNSTWCNWTLVSWLLVVKDLIGFYWHVCRQLVSGQSSWSAWCLMAGHIRTKYGYFNLPCLYADHVTMLVVICISSVEPIYTADPSSANWYFLWCRRVALSRCFFPRL